MAIATTNGWPHFSADEMDRRHRDLFAAAAEHDVARILVVGADRSGTAVQWLTGWPVTREAYVVLEPGEQDVLFVGFYNHVPQARQVATEADVRWIGPKAVDTVAGELIARGAGQRWGVVGPLSARMYRGLTSAGLDVVDLGSEYTRLRQVKSDEELDWLRRGAELSDAGIAQLTASMRSGITEYELGDIVERGYVSQGGTTHIHYFGVTPMESPSRANPAQHPSGRRVAPGDAVVVELSAAFGGYAGQVLRSFSVEAEPTPLYERMHEVAEQAFDAVRAVLRPGTTIDQIQEAASVIEDAGFTTIDDLVHGFGGGYLPPVIGSRSRDIDRTQTDPVRAGMTLVVQPNVATPDGSAGVQFGELLHVTDDGAHRLHAAPRGLVRVG